MLRYKDLKFLLNNLSEQELNQNVTIHSNLEFYPVMGFKKIEECQEIYDELGNVLDDGQYILF